jgi:hypothetical protein
MHLKKLLFPSLLLLSITIKAQNNNEGQLHGNFQIDMQSYTEDSLIGANKVPEKVLMNSYANLTYTKGSFTAGIRYEAYMNTMKGYPSAYNGNGIPYRFITYNSNDLEITAGSFYEQFGNGLTLRTYEEKGLGYDNAFDGMRIKYQPLKGLYIKGLVGKQRYYFDKGPGIVRGIDGEINTNELFSFFSEAKTQVIIGGSFVSKYQEDKDPAYNFPENVGVTAARINITRGGFNINSEYAYKINDPSSENSYIYKPGEALLISTSYSKKGFGLLLNAKRIDNMSFRSSRNATGIDLNINYLPILTKSYTYSFLNFYPYATQPTGEIGGGGELMYKFKKETFLGGKYGTNISINYSRLNSIDKQNPSDTSAIGVPGTLGYSSDFAKPGNELYYQDFNVEINKKFSKKFSGNFIYQNLIYNSYVLRKGHGTVYGNAGVADMIYKINDKKALHIEMGALFTKQDLGNWAMLQVEYSIAPKWFFSITDQYNYGNEEASKQLHYYTGSITFVKGGNRIHLGYGRQRQGIMCVGGVCRAVPASNGFILAISSSF